MTSTLNKIVLQTDPEHGGIRLVIFVALFVALTASFFLVRALLRLVVGGMPDYGFFLSCAGSIPLALLVVWGLEVQLKRVWPSGRQLVMDGEGIQARDNDEELAQLAWTEGVKPLSWYFELSGFPRVGRERRVQKGWYCLAIQLRVEERRIIAFTFMPPQQAQRVFDRSDGIDFHEIDPDDVYETSLRLRVSPAPPARPEIPSQVLAGEDGRYWLAEKRRWDQGFELVPDDFVTYLTFIQMQIKQE